MMCAIAAPGRAQSAPEYDVKAALLLNFARFIEWPDAAFETRRRPSTSACSAPSPFGQALDARCRARPSANRSLSAREVHGAADSAGCHLLFVPAGAESRAAAVSRKVRTAHGHRRGVPPLRGYGRRGKPCHRRGPRPVQREPAAGRRRGVRISARMLQLASRVERATQEK